MNDLQIYIQFNNQKREFMKKRLTMFFAVLFLCMGTALAQTKVSGTVLSQEDGQPIIGAAVKVVVSTLHCPLVRTSWRLVISVICLRP